jgi:hypothetical protein
MNAIQIDRIAAKLLNEQIAPSIKANLYKQALNTPKALRSKEQQAIVKPGKQGETLSKFWDTYHHDIMFGVSIAALLIPIPGVNVAVSGMISGADAAMYWAEGDRYSAMTMAAFALMPGMGKLVSKIPGLKQLGAAGMRGLFRKVIQAKRGVKVAFNWVEQQVLKLLPKNKNLIQSEFSKFGRKIVKKVTKSKVGRKVGRGVARAPIGAAKVAAQFKAADLVQQNVVSPVYTGLGLDIKDIEDGNLADLQAIIALDKQMK